MSEPRGNDRWEHTSRSSDAADAIAEGVLGLVKEIQAQRRYPRIPRDPMHDMVFYGEVVWAPAPEAVAS